MSLTIYSSFKLTPLEQPEVVTKQEHDIALAIHTQLAWTF